MIAHIRRCLRCKAYEIDDFKRGYCRECLNAFRREWRASLPPEERKARDKADYKKYREEKLCYNRDARWELKVRVFQKLGSVCKHCGFTDWRALQIDHVHGDGKKDRKNTAAGGSATYTFLRKVLGDETGRYQLLCANCNWIKRWEKQEMPQPAFGPPRSSLVK